MKVWDSVYIFYYCITVSLNCNNTKKESKWRDEKNPLSSREVPNKKLFKVECPNISFKQRVHFCES